mgnify:CR=1 FL=1
MLHLIRQHNILLIIQNMSRISPSVLIHCSDLNLKYEVRVKIYQFLFYGNIVMI